MQTNFSPEQRRDPDIQSSDAILRSCVHCGFCTATCPTYLETGDELDGPRGRIYLIKEMLETGDPPSAKTVKHLDRCLSCLSCLTTCPSSVNYMHLIDHGRAYVETHYQRPAFERITRGFLSWALPNPSRFSWLMRLGHVFRPLLTRLGPLFPSPLRAAFELIPPTIPASSSLTTGQLFPAVGERRFRVALIAGCVQQVLRPQINEATIRLLTRHWCDVLIANTGCCGSLAHHLGKTGNAQESAKSHIRALMDAHQKEPLDAVIINASGCGTTVKDYGFMLRNDPQWAEPAAFVTSLARDVSEFVSHLELQSVAREPQDLTVAYQSACSLQHGQKVHAEPIAHLRSAGFTVTDLPDAHLCCGSAGTYNILQADMAAKLKERKQAAIKSVAPDIVATGNIGCLVQLSGGSSVPVVHTVELLDWATGGPKPPEMQV